jgi:hypothetical protein
MKVWASTFGATTPSFMKVLADAQPKEWSVGEERSRRVGRLIGAEGPENILVAVFADR